MHCHRALVSLALLGSLSGACGSDEDTSVGSTTGAGASGTGGSGTGAFGTGGSAAGGANAGGSGAGGATTSFPCGPEPEPGPLAPTWYVDFDGGDDMADGATAATAWKHAPGDTAATGNAAGAMVGPGDVVVFKGGVAYQGAIDIPASGTADSPVVYDGNSRGTFGTGRALVDGGSVRAAGFTATDKSWFVIDSFDIAHFDKTQDPVAIAIDGGSNAEIAHCDIRDVYYPTNPGGTSWEQQSGSGIAVNNSPGTKVHHNSVRDVGGAGIAFTAGSGVVVEGGEIACNEVTNMNWGIAVALGNSTPGTTIRGTKIVGNYIHDFDQYYVCAAWHRDGLFVFARPDTDQATIEDLEIAYNYFEDNTSDLGSTAWIYFEYVCKNFDVHHNVLNASRSYYAIRILGDGFQVEGNHRLSNNVIDNANGIGDGMHVQESSGLTLRNNVFYVDGYAYIIAASAMDGFSADYDLVYRVGGPGNVVALDAGPAENPGGTTYDLAALQAATAHEAHGSYGDPLFGVAPASIDADPTGFAPEAASPAVDHGVDLGYATDFVGNPVPAGAGPDIGAFER